MALTVNFDLRSLCELDGDIFDTNLDSQTHSDRKHKSERRAERNERYKERRRVRRRAKIKEKRADASQKRRMLLDSMTTAERTIYINNERAEQERISEETRLRLDRDVTAGRLKIWISLDFMDVMSEKERKSLAKQIQWIWNSIVRSRHYSVKLSVGPFIEEGEFHRAALILGFVNWTINCDLRTAQEALDVTRVIVLSPDAEVFLTTEDVMDDENVFVVGGLVDRTVRKNETLTMARHWDGVRCRKLPLHMSPVKVHGILNVNTVYDILAAIKFDSLEWGAAVARYTPARRQGENKPRRVRIRPQVADESSGASDSSG